MLVVVLSRCATSKGKEQVWAASRCRLDKICGLAPRTPARRPRIVKASAGRSRDPRDAAHSERGNSIASGNDRDGQTQSTCSIPTGRTLGGQARTCVPSIIDPRHATGSDQTSQERCQEPRHGTLHPPEGRNHPRTEHLRTRPVSAEGLKLQRHPRIRARSAVVAA